MGYTILYISEIESRKIIKAFNYFYYIGGRFPTNNDLITAPGREVLDFIYVKPPDQRKSPRGLYEMFTGTKSHALVSTQFPFALNIYLDGDLQTSKDPMNEYYHNLSIQALSKLKYEVILNLLGLLN